MYVMLQLANPHSQSLYTVQCQTVSYLLSRVLGVKHLNVADSKWNGR